MIQEEKLSFVALCFPLVHLPPSAPSCLPFLLALPPPHISLNGLDKYWVIYSSRKHKVAYIKKKELSWVELSLHCMFFVVRSSNLEKCVKSLQIGSSRSNMWSVTSGETISHLIPSKQIFPLSLLEINRGIVECLALVDASLFCCVFAAPDKLPLSVFTHSESVLRRVATRFPGSSSVHRSTEQNEWNSCGGIFLY